MSNLIRRVLRFLLKTPVRTFILYPTVTFFWELWLNHGSLRFQPLFLILMLWGYLQYRLCGDYRMTRGGGRGLSTGDLPDRVVASGLYAYTRNPMYLGHIIYLIGMSLTLQSVLAGLITITVAVWFHVRVLGDERRLAQHLGQPYVEYLAKVKRWIPGVF